MIDWATILSGLGGLVGGSGLGAYLQARASHAHAAMQAHEERAWTRVGHLEGVLEEMRRTLDLVQDQLAAARLQVALLERDADALRKDAAKAVEREQAAWAQNTVLLREVEALRSELSTLRQQLGGEP